MIKQCSVAAVLLAVSAAPAAHAHEQDFSGFYLGAEATYQNAIGGASVGGVDMLEQDSVLGVGLFAGYRHQFSRGLVIGAEGGLGWEDGDLHLSNAPLEIDYQNAYYWRFGGLIGWAFGANTLAYVYAHETTRTFDVVVNDGASTFTQSDEQGLLGYGVGVEHRIGGARANTLFRARIGKSRGNFSGPRNIDPDRPIDISAGLTFQF